MAELREEAEREQNEGLCNPLSIDIFETWYVLGGPQSPPSLSELVSLPAWLLRDIRYIFTQLGDARERVRQAKKQAAFLTESKASHDNSTSPRKHRSQRHR